MVRGSLVEAPRSPSAPLWAGAIVESTEGRLPILRSWTLVEAAE